MKNLILCASLCATFLYGYTQEDDHNIEVRAKETYRFTTGDKAHPVVVKQTQTTEYYCNNFRVDLPIVEQYDDQLELNNIEAKVNGTKMRNLKPTHEYYGGDGIFYSDARVCYFTLPIQKKETSSQVTVEKTTLDPRYFTSIYFTDKYFQAKKEIDLIVPQWMKLEIKEYNFAGFNIISSKTTESGNTIYHYTISNAEGFKKEKGAPGMSHLAPHLLIMCKEAEIGGTSITYFKTLQDQYTWYHQLIGEVGNDHDLIRNKAIELTRSLNTDTAKVKALFQWVQDNIRYIAFEDGIAGFKPAKAQDVLGKKYGDCKGMANLMAEMLKGLGLDARICWLGTNHIAYDYSTPSLCVDNHMICAWLYKGKIYYLDPTETYIGFNEIAERIQGRQVLIENGKSYLLERIPMAYPSQNLSIEKRKLAIRGNDLVGSANQTWKGENKEWILTKLHTSKSDKVEEQFMKFLGEGNANYEITDLKVFNLDDYNADLRIEYNLVIKDAVVAVGKEMFIDLDNRKDFADMDIDTASRKFPYQFYFKTHLLFETEVDLPANATVATMPEALQIDNPAYLMRGKYKLDKSRLFYAREIELKNTWLPRAHFGEWNLNIGKLNEFYNNQLALTNK